MTQRILIRTTTEEFEIDEAALAIALEGYAPKYADPDGDPDGIIVDWFERHGGSAYCDEIVGNVDFDVGYEIVSREDDE